MPTNEIFTNVQNNTQAQKDIILKALAYMGERGPVKLPGAKFQLGTDHADNARVLTVIATATMISDGRGKLKFKDPIQKNYIYSISTGELKRVEIKRFGFANGRPEIISDEGSITKTSNRDKFQEHEFNGFRLLTQLKNHILQESLKQA